MRERTVLTASRGWPVGLFALAIFVAIGTASAQTRSDIPRDTPPGLTLWETATAPEIPVTPDLLVRGRELYLIRCATCHGVKGDGQGPASLFLTSPPRDFTRGVYKFRTTAQDGMPADMDLFRSITTGFPAYGMPSFRYLSEKDRWALVHYVKGFYPNWEKFGKPEVVAIGPDPPEHPDAIIRGKVLYEKRFSCIQCHGVSGQGDGPRAPELRDPWNRPISPRDFTLGPTFRKAGWRPADMVRALITGLPGTPMPSYIDQLTDPSDLRELWDVARYVEHLTEQRDRSRKMDKGPKMKPPAEERGGREKVLDRLSLFGDLRFRHETDTDLDDQPTRNRQRVRFRFGARYPLNDEALLGARLTTGDRLDPNSPHQTLGNVFHNFDVNLDQVFVTYRPQWAPGLWGTAGKFEHPFWRNPVYGDLVWDADVQPEGGALGFSLKGLGILERTDVTVGQYIILEQRSGDEVWVSVGQATAHARLDDHWRLSLALGAYRYTELTPGGSQTILADNSGNATVDTNSDGKPDHFQSNFGIVNPIVALTYDRWQVPLTLSGEYFRNTRAHGPRNQGGAVGVSLGSAQKRGDWRVYYQWQGVEQDAVLSVFAQDDFLFQTNHRSHVFGANYQFWDKTGLHLWGLVSKRDKTLPGLTTDNDKDQWRLRADLNLKF